MDKQIKSINIFGIDYKVEFVEQVNKNQAEFGEIDFFNKVIKIDKNTSLEQQQTTLWHEILHGICQALGLEITNNESLMCSLATGIFTTLQNNKGTMIFP